MLDAALAAFALEPVADWPCRWLSAGQRRRLALARLLVAPAPIWLLDEPTAALDHDGQERLEQAIIRHRAAGGRVLAATHSPISLDGANTIILDDFAPLFAAAAPAISMPMCIRSSMVLIKCGLIFSRNSLLWAAAACAS